MPDVKRAAFGYWVKTAEGRERYVADERPEVPAVRTKGSYTPSKEALDKIYAQTGEHFDDYGQYKAWCKLHKKREIEKGEILDESWRIFAEWTRAGQPGKCPLPAMPPMKERVGLLSELQQKMASSGELRRRADRLGFHGKGLDEIVRIPLPEDQER